MSNQVVDGGKIETQPQQGFGARKGIRAFDLLDFGGLGRIGAKVNLIDDNHRLRHFISPDQGHKYLTLNNPTPAVVNPLLETMKEPSMLLLRGCELLLQAHFSFERFKTITFLEISGISYLTTIPDAISEITQLQSLTLSHLPIKQLPDDEFFSKLRNLHSFTLRDCSNFHSLPKFPQLPTLQYLELSDLPIETLPDEWDSYTHLIELRWVILRGCSKLSYFTGFFTEFLEKIEVLDLSHCTTLTDTNYWYPNLRMIDVSYTAFPVLEVYSHTHLTHLFARDIKEFRVWSDSSLPILKMVDISGAQKLTGIERLEESLDLVALDLSRTGVESIEFISHLIHLRHLILKECTMLVHLPEMKRLTNLEVLDISGCEILADLPEDLHRLRNLKELNLSKCSALKELREGLFDEMPCLEKLDLSETSVSHLPSFANLTNLQTLHLSKTSEEELPELSNLINLKEFVRPKSNKIDFSGDHAGGKEDHLQEKVVSNPDEFHLVSTFISDSGFDRFIYEFKKLDDLISNIEKNIKSASCSTTTINVANMISQTFKRSFGRTRADLEYILKNIDRLERSNHCSSGEELLHELMDVAAHLTPDNFPIHSKNLDELLRVVAKLKLLIPPPKQVDLKKEGEEEDKKKKKKNPRFTISNDEEDFVCTIENMIPLEMENLHSSYESLTNIQKNCLLYFAVFPYSDNKYIRVKETVLLNLWYGEGFFEPASSTKNPQPTLNQSLNHLDPTSLNPKLDMCMTKESGEQILEVLKEKKFICKSKRKRRWSMKVEVHNYIKSQAKEERFFDFDNHNGKLTQRITAASKRACLLKSQNNFRSSCKLWLNYTNSSEKLERFNYIHTLLYVDEPVVDINIEWFSCMRNLFVLHLASLRFKNEEQIDMVDLKFLEGLENMKQLRLLTIEGFSGIQKLPSSICKVTSLKMLNLTDCSHLEELPAGIGSLGNLTHLDLTNCHLLHELPKGVSFLSKLEVLKGFSITYMDGGRQHTKACTLQELLKLKNLRKLNLVVNRDNFPGSKDLQVLKKMKNLCNLKITWKRNYYKDQELHDGVAQEALMRSRWKQFKCWAQDTHDSDTEEEEEEKESLKSSHFDNLTKLVLCCFPSIATPNWLHQGQFQKLDKLYLVGGNLKALPGDPDQSAWNIKTLHLKYLPNLEREPNGAVCSDLFPNLEYCKTYRCPLIVSSDFDSDSDSYPDSHSNVGGEYLTYCGTPPYIEGEPMSSLG